MAILKYQQIKDDIIQRIFKGEMNPGDKIPTEVELREHYKVSSTTVTKALNELVAEGYIFRIQGKGSFVAKTNIGTVVRYFDYRRKIENHKDEYRRLIDVVDISATISTNLFKREIDAKKITRVKGNAEGISQYLETYIDASYLGEMGPSELSSLYESIRMHKSINLHDARFEQVFTVAYPAPKYVLDTMGLPEGTPLIKAVQHTYGPDREIIEITESYLKSDSFQVKVESL